MQFKQYIKQDDHYRSFLSPSIVWNPRLENYGFITETSGLKRAARNLMEDCQDFLHILATFLPHGYLTDKIVTNTTSFVKAFEVIQEHYGLLPRKNHSLILNLLTSRPGKLTVNFTSDYLLM